MEFRILGPLEVRDDEDRPVELGGRQQRLVLAALLLQPNRVVSTDRLIDVLWGERAPASAVKSVQIQIARLRKALEPAMGGERALVRTSTSGYVLELAPDELDVRRFEALVESGRRLLAEGAAEQAATVLREALALWRGPPLADFAYDAFAETEIRRLEELRLGAVEERIEAELALDRHADVTAELQRLVAEHPLRERVRGQLMVALYRTGRKAEALAVYDEARRLLAEELGLAPGENLRRLQRAVLDEDPALSAPERPVPSAPTQRPVFSGRTGSLLVVGGALLVAAALAVAAPRSRGIGPRPESSPWLRTPSLRSTPRPSRSSPRFPPWPDRPASSSPRETCGSRTSTTPPCNVSIWTPAEWSGRSRPGRRRSASPPGTERSGRSGATASSCGSIRCSRGSSRASRRSRPGRCSTAPPSPARSQRRTTQENPPPPASAGDVIRVSTSLDFGTDPAQSLGHIAYATCAKLLNYPDAPAPEGTRLVSEVAATMPTLSPDGRTYTFTIRDGFAFSPPRRERVTAQTFKHAIERSLSPLLGPAAAAFVPDIAGEDAYLAGKDAHISGLVAKGRTLSITLVEPDPSFLHRIAMPFFCAVPLDTPVEANVARAIPSAGPYYVASEVPGRRIVLKRNPNYRGSRPRRPREIHFVLGVERSKSIDDVLAGRADYALDGPPPSPSLDAELLARYGPASAAARAGRQQYFVEPWLGFAYLELNTGRRLFSDVRLRKAVNYAIDRRALARLGSWLSGPFPSIPTQQYLPPTLPGAARGVLYPPGGDLQAARRLAPDADGTAVLYTCSDDARICRRAAELVKANLAPLGLKVDIKEFPYPEQFLRAQSKGEPYDIVIAHWGLDYPDPSDVLNALLEPRDLGPELARELERAARLSGPARYAAYRSLSLEIARDAAPWVPYAVGSSRDLFSARIGCQLFHPVYQMDLGALCIR
jgi:DNA-binding SARP family transcriptional activator/ABC-type oligopeptide transport system substrate-binding subunit